MSEYRRAFVRYMWVIAGFALLGGLAGLVSNLTTLPVYQARTSIDIQSLNGDFMNMKTVAPTSEDSAVSGDSYVQTQIKLLEGDTLLENTVARIKAEAHPVFVERKDLMSRVKRVLHVDRSEPLSYNDAVDFAAQNVKVKPLGLTRLIEITCDSWSPDVSAKLCNTLTAEFQAEDQQSRAQEAQKTSEWLARQAEDVKTKAEDSEKQLEAAVGGNGLILSQESNTVGEDRLRNIQEELVRAQADRMEKEAQTAIASSSSPDSVPGIVDRPAYQAYQQKLADLRAQLAQLVPPLTEENPKVIHVRSQIREAEAGLAAERSSDADRMRNDFDAARHREALLKATYDATLGNVSSDLSKASRVRLLKSEVDSEQQLYQTLLQRAKEAGFASAMHASTVHVVDAARAPRIPIAPRRGSTAALGVMLGSLAGIGFAFFKERSGQVLRLPGDSERYLRLHELGVIPSAGDGGSSLASAARSFSSGLGRQGTMAAPGHAVTMVKWDDSFSLVAEAYRGATLSMMLSESSSKSTRTYVVTSPAASDGKTSVTSNLGVALSKSKLRVLLIDGDLRRPSLHLALGVPNRRGVRDLLESDTSISNLALKDLCISTNIANLSVLPAGTGKGQALDLLHTVRLPQLLQQLSYSFDVILIDTPPMLHMADARLIAGNADGVILVLRSGVTMREDAVNALSLFSRDGIPVIGTILNDFNPSREGYGDYYKSYYGYKSADAERQQVGAR